MQSEPETVTEAVALLEANGFTETLSIEGGVLSCTGWGSPLDQLDQVVVQHVYRFEGPSDPGDESIVIGVEHPGRPGGAVLVSAFGPDAEPEAVAILQRLSQVGRAGHGPGEALS